MTQSMINIRRPRVSELMALRRLFCVAVREHFAYFPLDYQQEIIDENTVWRLFLGMLNPRRAVYVAVSQRKLLGYIIAGQGGSDGQIYWLFVDPEARGCNTGSRLLNRALDHLRRQRADRVLLNTHDHEKYYHRYGFKSDKSWKLHGVPVVAMSLDLKGGSK